MKIARQNAARMAEALSQLPLGHLQADMLEDVMNNYIVLSRIFEDFKNLNFELHKRLYAGIDEAVVKEFFALIMKGKNEEAAAFDYIYPIFMNHERVAKALALKEIEADVKLVDEDAFVKDILRGQKDISIAEIRQIFAPMFIKAEKPIQDFSELDDLLKQH